MRVFKIVNRKYSATFILSLLCLSFHAFAQQFDPFNGKAVEFHVQFSRYFKSGVDEKASRIIVIDSVSRFKRDSAWAPGNLRSHLDAYEKLLVSIERHYQYFTLKCYVNNKDTLSKQVYSQLGDSIGSLQGMVSRMLLRPNIVKVTGTETKYRYLLEQSAREATHNLTDQEEAVINRLSDAMTGHLTDRYDDLMDQIKAGNRSAILKSPDSVSRRTGMAAYYKAYDDHGELFAATLIDIALQKTAQAKLRGFKSATERAYQRSLQLPEASVKQLLVEITEHAGVLQDYQRLQSGQVKRVTGLGQVHSWDTFLPTGLVTQPMSYEQAKTLILAALAPLGSEYAQAFAHLLDPANGKLDIAGGPDRVTEFTSVGFPGVPESLYMKSFSGSEREVSRLAHEGGHAVHEQLMGDHLAVPSYSKGPGFLFEAYAIFNELLLMDELEKRAKTPINKAYYTKMFLDKLSLELFTSVEEGTFEQGLYDGVADGNIHNREDIDNLYASIMNPYDIYFAGEPERRSEWTNKRLLYDDPIYNVNYLYAILVSCKLYTMVHQDQQGFALKYTALLKNGFDAPATDLLKKIMGFGLDHEALLKGALGLMKSKTALLQTLYQSF
ncbi:M3 family metallopeptidase [Mucilaginibacter dorajii]|uniref:Peptidase M3A/M3B catalytic domain-containing protein n=1 Tax=Mucilaginibacter dorajii TaxID=692994 RepID=A0ABP7QZI1_9SPHI|nr:M3 family metallopeptidase [Mucilaginibacter dorajii]MCS3732255.1 oligoendopeptidase F [Mucilaginibacter dorajii]